MRIKNIGKYLCLISFVCIAMLLNIYAYSDTSYKSARIVMDVRTGRILFRDNIYTKLPMASTTKIMTALIALENIPLNKKVTINPQAVGIEGSSIYLESKEKIKAIDLIYGLMLQSGNDAATALAFEISGSTEAFVNLMNTKALKLGAKNTNFTNPHGLYNKDHYTTAYDLALITREALKNPIFKKIVKSKYWLADRNGYKHFSNKNKILDLYTGGDGVKTGYTKASGRCLVASATKDNMQFIAITLNDGDWFNTAINLLDRCFSEYKSHCVFNRGDPIKNIKIQKGSKTHLILEAADDLILPMHMDKQERILSVISGPDKLVAPITKGEKIGKISTYKNGELINVTPLIAKENIATLKGHDRFLKFLKFK